MKTQIKRSKIVGNYYFQIIKTFGVYIVSCYDLENAVNIENSTFETRIEASKKFAEYIKICS